MATPRRPIPAATLQPRRLSRGKRTAAVLLLVLAAMVAWYARPLLATARTGAAYGARVACSCRFVAGRPLGDCRKDFEPGMGLVTLSADEASRRVTARFALLVRQSATYREGWGCQLDRWAD